MKKVYIAALLSVGFFQINTINAQANQKLKEIAKELTYTKSNEVDFIRLKTDRPIYETNTERFLNSMVLNEGVTVQKQKTQTDELGFTHTKYELVYNNTVVNNAIIIAHSQNGKLVSINGDLNGIKKPVNSVVIDKSNALTYALKKVNARKYAWENKAQEAHLKQALNQPDFTFYPKGDLILFRLENSVRYAYKFSIYADEPRYGANVYVDAQTGEIIAEENLICTLDVPGTANTKFSGVQSFTVDNYSAGNYRLRETGRGNGIETYNLNYGTAIVNTDFTYTNTVWPNTGANQLGTDGHWGAEMTYDYYKILHNRNSIDNAGFKLISYVNQGTISNASWNGFFMTYGGGSGGGFIGLDICGHEITHGLTTKTSNLVYSNESGALNESYSDIFGASIENYAKPLAFNWTIGEDVGGIRSMSNPNSFGNPDTYLGTNWYAGTADNGGVHTNSGVSNYWYYLLTMGGTGTNDIANTYSVGALGIIKAGKIAFRALTVYYTPSTNYASARNLSIQAAGDLYGACSNEVFQTTNAWHAVGVGAASGGTLAPVANFNSSGSSLCSLPVSINFVNTTFGGTTYTWNFGDGSSTSAAVNPLHTYTANGSYTVKLKSVSVCSAIADSITKMAYIVVNAPVPPTATGGTVCGYGSATITASGSGQQYWYPTASTFNTPLNIGNNFTTPFISTTTTYYVANTFTNAALFGGPPSLTVGTNGTYPSNAAYDVFDVMQPCSLKTVVIKANFAGNRTIELRSSTNAVISSTVVNLPAGTSTVNVDFALNTGTGFRLGLGNASTAQLFRNSTGIVYPYNIGGLVNITGCSTPGPYFYFFYNWEVVADNCTSTMVPVTVTVVPGPPLTLNSPSICAGQTASVIAGGATNYTWSTGSNNATIAVTPTTNTTYTISADNGGCVITNTTMVTVSALPTVSLSATKTNVCQSDSLVLLTGSPSGGVYSGTGVSGVNFNPTTAGSGTFTILYNYTDANNCTNSGSTNIMVGACVSIQEFYNSTDFTIYPNPANDFFVVKSTAKIVNLTLKVTDATGKLIIDKSLNTSSEHIDISKLAKGIYFIEMQEASKAIYRTKIVKQ